MASTIQGLIDQLNATAPGNDWKIFGSATPTEETTPVPVAANAATGAPATTANRGTGRYFVTVVDKDGHTRALPLKADDPSLTRSGLSVRQSGVNDTVPDTTPDAKGRVDPAATKPNPDLYGGDLSKLQWTSGGALTDVPATPKQPSATSKLTALDSQGNVVPAGDASAKQMRDDATGTTFNLVSDPKGEIHDVGNDVWLIKPDGTHTVVGSKPDKPTTMNVPGVGLVEYDPSKPEGSRTTTVMPTPTNPNDLGGIQTRNGVSYVPTKDADGTIKFVEAGGLPQDQTVDHYYDDPNSRNIQLIDKQGNVIKTLDKGADWKPPVRVQPGTAPATDAVNPYIQVFDPTTGDLKFVPNQNQVKASQATSDLAKQLGQNVAAGSMSEDAAQKLITSAINVQNSQSQKIQAQAAQTQADTAQQQNVTTAAGDILTNARGNATTGAGMLQQRAQAATGTLQSLVGNALGNKNFGAGGGNLGDIGGNLVQGLTGWTADLMGGQATMDSAARMVQAADPQSSMADPTTQAAVATLRQMLDKHQELTGQPHPAVAATQAAQQSQQVNGMAAPQTYNPNDIQWNQPPQNAPGRTMGPGGVITGPQPVQAVAPVQPVPVASGFTAPGGAVPGQNYGAATAYTGGVAPWLAQPQPAFVAPMPQPLTPQMVRGY